MKKSFGKLYIRKRPIPEWLVIFVLFLPFAQAFLSEFLGLPDSIKFLTDVALVGLLLKIFMISSEMEIKKSFHPFLVLIGIFFAYVTVTYFFNYQSIFYFIWGLRNNFRFYVAFISFVIFLKWEDVQKFFEIFDVLYVINFLLVLVQFMMGYQQDFLGGIFGVQKGCNGGVIIFMSFVMARQLLLFMRNEGSTIKCVLFSLLGLLVAALAELKVFFLLFILIAVVTAMITKGSVKKALFFVFCTLVISISSTILSLLYDEFQDFLSLEKLWEALLNPNYSSEEDVGRLTAIPVISKRFHTGVLDKLFGMGLGNADSSSLAIFNTPFFKAYSSIHYTYFVYAFLYLEVGIVGLLMYAMFFVLSFFAALRLRLAKMADDLTCQLTMIFSGVCLVLVFYNVALRAEMAGYLAYFVLALPLISAKATRPKN